MKQQRLFYDMFLCKYFESTFENIMRAEQQLNQALLRGATIRLRSFYEMVGIDEIDFDSVFERSNNYVWASFDREPTIVDNNLECIILSPPFKMEDGIVKVFSTTRKMQITL